GGVGLRCVDARRQSSLGDLDQVREGGRVVDGELGEHATVDLDTGGLEALDETVVGHAVGAGAGVDALDPEATEVTLALATVTVAVDQRMEDRFLGLAVQAPARSAVAAGAARAGAALAATGHRPRRRPVQGSHLPLSLPRSLRALARSPPVISWSVATRRLRAEVLPSNLCWLFTPSRMILPVPVTRMRFLALLFVFCFGMVPFSFAIRRRRQPPATTSHAQTAAGLERDVD